MYWLDPMKWWIALLISLGLFLAKQLGGKQAPQEGLHAHIHVCVCVSVCLSVRDWDWERDTYWRGIKGRIRGSKRLGQKHIPTRMPPGHTLFIIYYQSVSMLFGGETQRGTDPNTQPHTGTPVAGHLPGANANSISTKLHDFESNPFRMELIGGQM